MASGAAAEKKVILLRPRGFCAGVVRAIDVVKIALDLYGSPIYVRKEIVHNRHVVDELREAGAIFVEELDEVPAGARVIFSAHGVSPAVREQAQRARLQVIDATCPLVTKVHLEAVRFARDGLHHRADRPSRPRRGDRNPGRSAGQHGPGVEPGGRGPVAAPRPGANRPILTQTTLSLDETRDIVARLKDGSRRSWGRRRRTSAMPRRTGNWR